MRKLDLARIGPTAYDFPRSCACCRSAQVKISELGRVRMRRKKMSYQSDESATVWPWLRRLPFFSFMGPQKSKAFGLDHVFPWRLVFVLFSASDFFSPQILCTHSKAPSPLLNIDRCCWCVEFCRLTGRWAGRRATFSQLGLVCFAAVSIYFTAASCFGR